jgi:hypothetical protein
MHGPEDHDDDEDEDEDILVLRSEISRLQMLERGISRASRSFTTFLEEEEEAKLIQQDARMRKAFSILLRLGFVVGMVFVIIVNFSHQMENKEVQFAEDGGGTSPVSMEQIRAHSIEDDCWVAFHGNVYDMALYAKQHPGGPSFITDLCAQDGTELYDALHPIGFLRIIDRYQIGPFVTEQTNESEHLSLQEDANV